MEHQEFEIAVDKIFEGNSVFFAGAGYSLGTSSISNCELVTLNGLKEDIFRECNMMNEGDIGWAIENFIEMYGENELINFLRKHFLVKEFTDFQKIIAMQNWRGIFTTNYDNLIETIKSENFSGKIYSTTSSSRPSTFSKKRDLIVHVNGFIENLDDDQPIPSDFLLKDIDFVTTNFINSDWYNHLQSDLATADAIFFVGFSMRSDLDISRIVYRVGGEEHPNRIYFIVSEDESSSSVKFLSRFGSVLKIGVNGFAKMLHDRSKVYVPKQSVDLSLFSFSSFQLKNLRTTIRTQDAFDLLFWGKFEQHHIESSLYNPNENVYFIRRTSFQKVLECVAHENRNILITSELGCGKTLFLEGLKIELKKRGFDVFAFQKWYDTNSTLNELNHICENFPNAVLIIEGYNLNSKLFEHLKTRRPRNMTVIFTERTAIHETTFTKLEKFFSTEVMSFDLSRLDEMEIKQVVGLLNEYGLWGDYSNYLDLDKERLIRTEFKFSFKILLIRIIESKVIIEKFKAIVDSIQQNKNYFEAVVLIFTANLFSVNLGLEEVISILNEEKFRKPSFQKDQAINELIDFSAGSIRAKSSILSLVILSKVSGGLQVVNALLKICRQLDHWEDFEVSRNLLREYVSFSNIRQILEVENNDYLPAVNHFFDEIRNLNFCRENPHYWLQYAILNLEQGRLDLAKSQFDTAYSFAKRKRGFDTYQLDNQFARYLLLHELNNPKSTTYMNSFKEAHLILTSSTSPNRLKYYPYKVAQIYVDFFNKFSKSASEVEREYFYHAINEIVERIEKYMEITSDFRIKGYVKRTKDQLVDILKNRVAK